MKTSHRMIKKEVLNLLGSDDLEKTINTICAFPPDKVVNPLLSALCSIEEQIKFHAVSALGIVVASIADSDMESARIIMRRLMWSLNDESGGIGWGAPEAMGEIMACHEALAAEFAQILVSYMREDAGYLEYLPLQRGLMWGIGRLAQVRAVLLHKWNCVRYLMSYLESDDPVVRGLAAWSAGNLKAVETRELLSRMAADTSIIPLYQEGRISVLSVGRLAQMALESIN